MTIEKQFIFCEKWKITFNELMFLRMLILAQNEECFDLCSSYFSLSTEIRGNIRDILVRLQELKIISSKYKIPEKGNRLIPEDIPINKNFIKNFHKDSFTLGKELFEAYPIFTIINGQQCRIKSVSKKFDSLEDFYHFYGKSISWNAEKHSQILELIKWGKEKNLINCTLANFVIDKVWEDLKILKSEEINPIIMETGESAKNFIKALKEL